MCLWHFLCPSVGWCYVSFTPDTRSKIHQRHLELTLSYELWTWLIIGAIILCVLLYIFVQCCKKYFGLCTGKKANVVRKVCYDTHRVAYA